MKKVLVGALASAVFFAAAPAQAVTVFSDDFNDEVEALDTTLDAFDVPVVGGVDVVGPATAAGFGITISGLASGNVVDIDGTPGPGAMTSFASYLFGAGDRVTLNFVLGGNERNSEIDDFSAFFNFAALTSFSGVSGTGLFSGASGAGSGLSLSNTILVPGTQAFTNSSYSFTAGNAGSFNFGFSSTSANNIGPLVDNVSLDIAAVPEPATWAMMIVGFGLIGLSARRRRSTRVSFA